VNTKPLCQQSGLPKKSYLAAIYIQAELGHQFNIEDARINGKLKYANR
jgi:hypothetical protein